MNAKQTLSTLGILVVLLVVAVALSFFGHAPANQIPQKSPILGGMATSTGGYQYLDDQQYYTVDVRYPATTSLDAAASQKMTQTIEQQMQSDIGQFKSDSNLDNLTAEDIEVQQLGGDRKYWYEATYDSYAGANTISFVYKIYVNTLGAHPNSYFETFTFDKNGNELKLGDLFAAGADYLTPISQAATVAVTKQLQVGLEMQDVSSAIFAEGIAPKDENFQNFAIDGDTLHIYIPPYQAAAYVAGSFDVAIPLSQLSTVLKPEVQ